MGLKYEKILKGGIVVDPVNRSTNRGDVAIANGKIVGVGADLDPTSAYECIPVDGNYVLPGIIDLHVHVSSWLGGGYGHRMMALAGVTTALDMSGPVDSVVELARKYGTGLNLATLQYVRPGHTVNNSNPGIKELEELLQNALQQGAYGLKILGGHYPLSPEATSRAIEVARGRNVYLALHAGTLETKSDIEGFHEAVQIIGDRAVTLAHINSYCRGRVKSYVEETEEAIEALKQNPHICSESYLSPFNGTSGKCSDGIPESHVTVMCLTAKGYEATEKGLEKAILEGWGYLNMECGGQVILETGENAVRYWHERNTNTTISFPVNPDTPRLRLASAKRNDEEFVVDCIITDGGGIPRNITVESGLCLVKLAVLSIEEFALKTGRNPARILGLPGKGHLGVGADADITVVDLERTKPVMSLANGKMVMFNGWICGNGTRMIVTPAGEKYACDNGLDVLVVDPADTELHRRIP